MKKNTKLFFIFHLLLIASHSFSQGVWTQKAVFPGGGRNNPFFFSIGGKGYVGTGSDSLAFITVNDFWEYDTTTNIWTQKANFGGGTRWKAVGFAIGDSGYAGAGIAMVQSSSYLKDLWAYNPASNSWTRKTDMPSATSGAASFVANGLGYVATATQNLFQYNPGTDSWVQKTNFPASARTGFSAFAIGGKGYVGLGLDTVMKRDFYEYTPATDTWRRIADFIGGGRTGAAAFALGCKGYIATGDSSKGLNSFYYSDLWAYDPASDLWTQQSYFTGAMRASTAFWSIGGKGYVGLGLYMNFYTDLYQYTPDTLCLLTGLPFVSYELQFSVYPNPAVNQLTVCGSQLAEEKITLEIYNVLGEKVWGLQTGANIHVKLPAVINVSSFRAGIYILKITSENGTSNFKIIKE